MALSHSPKIVTDGLVFMYDTGDGKSYKGEPTTNYGPASFGDWGTEGTAERIATGNTYKGQPTYNCRTEVGVTYKGIDKTVTGLRTAAGSSGTVTVSCMIRNNNSTAYNTSAYIGHDFSGNISIAANSDWQKIQWTVNQSSMNNDYVEFRPYTNNASIYLEMTMPMVEVNKGHATQFVDGTRSTTQGLIDRTGNTTIDLSNASFDSNAQMTFDGTNDYAEVADQNSLDLTTAMSFEFVVKPDSSQSNPYPRLIDKSVYLLHLTSTSPFGVYQNIYTSGGLRQTGISSVVTAGNWNHIVCTYDGQYGKIYVDAELVKTIDFGSVLACNTNSSSLKIAGDGTTNRPLNGEMPISKIYNKVLTAAEVLQNYNATKSRFS